jgi:hypothetical protein
MTDILQAITTLVNHPIPNLLDYYRRKSQNRINAVGDALEECIKDIFADTIDETNLDRKTNKYNQVFSWQGNQNNPPDLIIRNGDAVEVKKKITYLRIRGMWGIKNPLDVYNYLNLYDSNTTFQIIAIMKETKYLSFPTASRNKLESCVNSNRQLSINLQNIKSPDNPEQVIPARIINYKMR